MQKKNRPGHQNGENHPPQGEHRHKEAFCLMRYMCDQCQLLEVLWNSRDGVTPMFVSCRACGSRMTHITWEQDKYAPDHTPLPGQRIFIDTPASLILPTARFSVFLGLQLGNTLPEGKNFHQMAEAIAEGYRAEEPFVITWAR